uniref:Uncharacterized protein n=1 Tax=Aegilops tauschii subsp. strangulata TaxID=200361 RepID=A0A453JBF7_AEGTS
AGSLGGLPRARPPARHLLATHPYPLPPGTEQCSTGNFFCPELHISDAHKSHLMTFQCSAVQGCILLRLVSLGRLGT